jgi:hypothetical protein
LIRASGSTLWMVKPGLHTAVILATSPMTPISASTGWYCPTAPRIRACWSIRKYWNRAWFEAVDLAAGKFKLTNRYAFRSLAHLDGFWEVRRDEELLEQGRLDALAVGAGETVDLDLPYAFPADVPGSTCWINFSFRLNERTLWAERGLELANAQFELAQFGAPEPAALEVMPDLNVDVFGEGVVVQGEDFRLVFDGGLGVITDWEYQGATMLLSGPRLNIWRAPTENDIHMAKQWREVGFDRLEQRVTSVDLEVKPQAVQLVVEAVLAGYSLPPALRCTYRYTIYGSGDVTIAAQVVPSAYLPELPRVGLQMTLPGDFDRLGWYGRGPHENYPDRKESALVGMYRGAVQDQYFPYIMPQENGNKSDVRWAALTSAQGIGLFADGAQLLNTSASHYRMEDLDEARHTYELEPRDETIFNLDYLQSGLGSNSCGPGPLPQYLIAPEAMSFSVRLRPFNTESISPAAIYIHRPKSW